MKARPDRVGDAALEESGSLARYERDERGELPAGRGSVAMDVPLILSAPVEYLTPSEGTGAAVKVSPVEMRALPLAVYPLVAPAAPASGTQWVVLWSSLSLSSRLQFPLGSNDT